jgi:heterotetrameric sarcosine oxidase delta subunit
VILLPCPYCGLRNASEFRYVGEVSERQDPNETGVEEWRAYLYARNNPAGWTTETWYHSAGCRQHFVAERHTVTNEVRSSRVFPYSPEQSDHTGGNVAGDGRGAIY